MRIPSALARVLLSTAAATLAVVVLGGLAANLVGTPEAQAQAPQATQMPQPVPDDALDLDRTMPDPQIVNVAPDAQLSPPAAYADAPVRDTLEVFLDRAKVIRLPDRTQTVVVGNPFIADISVQPSGIVVLTGKAYGSTNLIALDAQGLLLAESLVSVRAATSDSTVVVQRGMERESYSCTPNCQPALKLGDGDGFFGRVGNQATQRSQLATQAQ